MKVEEVIKRLEANGWQFKRLSEGSHRVFEREGVIRTLNQGLHKAQSGLGRAQLTHIARRFDLDPKVFLSETRPEPRLTAKSLESLEAAVAPAPSDALPIAIRRSRENAGMSQNDLASRLSVPLGIVRDWEIGLHTPNLSHRAQLSELFRWGDRHYVGGVSIGPREEVTAQAQVEADAAKQRFDQIAAAAAREVQTSAARLEEAVKEEQAVAAEPAQDAQARARRITMHVEGLVTEIIRLRAENAQLQAQLAKRQTPPEDEAVGAFVALDDLRRFLG